MNDGACHPVKTRRTGPFRLLLPNTIDALRLTPTVAVFFLAMALELDMPE